MKNLEVGQKWKKLKRCPACGKRKGYFELDGMTTMACLYCGSRFLQTPFGVEYIGDWGSYAFNSRWIPPIKLEGING